MNWIFKNKKIPCENSTSEFFCKLKNILCSKRTKTILVVLVLVCVFCLASQNVYAANKSTGTSVPTLVANGIDFITGWGTAGPLYVVQVAIGVVFAIETALFAAIVDPNTLSGTGGILNRQGVQDVWIMVRDLLNMFFILVLLFSAFCTIFQVDKWSLKKLWLNILINALLVNFSWPIARFFIDVSNVAMYYFMNNMFTSVNGSSEVAGSTIFATILGLADITNILSPFKFATSGVSGQLISVIFSFLFAVTLGIIAVLFVIRMVALTILLIFSPIGFVGYIFPAASSLADKWWKALFSNAFFGPIMMLGLVISIKLMSAFQDSTSAIFNTAAIQNVSNEGGTWIAKVAYSIVPIVVLWATMGVAKSMGAAGANTIVDGAQGLAKKFGKFLVKSAWNATGVPGGVKKGWEDARKKGTILGKPVPFLKDTKDERESWISAGISGGSAAQQEAVEKKRAENFRKRYKEKSEEHETTSALGANGLVDGILSANLHDPDPNKAGGNAIKVAAMGHALKTGRQKEEFELELRSQIISKGLARGGAMLGMSDIEKETYIKKETAKNWKVVEDKIRQAQEVAKKEKGLTTGPVIDKAYATANGAQDVWT